MNQNRFELLSNSSMNYLLSLSRTIFMNSYIYFENLHSISNRQIINTTLLTEFRDSLKIFFKAINKLLKIFLQEYFNSKHFLIRPSFC